MKITKLPDIIADMVMRPKEYGFRDCVLCGREQVHVIGVHVPGEEAAKKLKQPEDKIRTTFYALCEECSKRGKAAADEAEALFIKDIEEGKPVTFLHENRNS
jgi:chloramphenicol 3-O-phosphotransferase